MLQIKKLTPFVISENEEYTLYVVTCNPVSLYFMSMAGKIGYFVDFFDIFPRTASGVWHPFVTVAPLGNPLNGQVVLHEQQVMHPGYSHGTHMPRVTYVE